MRGRVILDYDPEEESKQARRDNLLDALDELEDDSLLSGSRPKHEKKKEKEQKEKQKKLSEDETGWMETISGIRTEPIKKKKKTTDIFDIKGTKKRRKRKKKEGELTDYNKEFEQEKRLYDNLLRDQSKFTASLQSRYDTLENTKSSARGVGKFTTDLIESINSARSLTLQIADKKANLKKTIADLTMKEKKDFGGKAGDETDIGLLGSSMLKRLLDETSRDSTGGELDIVDGSIDDIYDSVSDEVELTDDDDEIGKYLKYESANVTIYVCINSQDNTDAYFLAKDDNGNEIDDYPLPQMTPLRINRSTNVATDTYSRHYPIIWV